ncbi:hypothetical protein NE865_12791 [Phthorimaea operculella]|nr:hypothetical protein NE865_12791 [Phthorimaea operculella]
MEQSPIADDETVDVQYKMYPSHRTKMPVDIQIKIESDTIDGDDWRIDEDINKQDVKLHDDILDSNEAHLNIFDYFSPITTFLKQDDMLQHIRVLHGTTNQYKSLTSKRSLTTVKELIDDDDKATARYNDIVEEIEKKSKAALEDNDKCLTEQRHSCTICNKEYSYKYWHSHMKDVHGDKNHECTICGAKFTCERYLRKHKLYRHENGIKASQKPNRQACPECPKTFKNSDCLGQHIKNCHANEVECQLCFKRLKSTAYLKTHMRRVHYDDDGKVHRCKICCKKFKSPRQVKIHVINLHPDTLHPCPHCTRKFYKAAELTNHVKKCKPKNESTIINSKGKKDEVDLTIDLTID